MVEFTNRWKKDEVFVNKSKLRGTKVMCTEFLTRTRYEIFQKCIAVYKKQCWTRNGVIVVLLKDGTKRFVSTKRQFEELNA